MLGVRDRCGVSLDHPNEASVSRTKAKVGDKYFRERTFFSKLVLYIIHIYLV